MGRVVEVYCESLDYALNFKNTNNDGIAYLIKSFIGHPGLNTNPGAVFRFKRYPKPSFYIDASRKPVNDDEVAARLAEMDKEGLGTDVAVVPHAPDFTNFAPEKPPRLYSMQLDQSICDLDGDDSFQYGDALSRLSPGMSISTGKINFVIDREGYLIVGPSGHQILSGGQNVAGAGHLFIELDGEVGRIDLNFSGHYRPELTQDYACYVYRIISGHPLLKLKAGCEFAGRKFIDLEAVSKRFIFTESDLRGENPDLDFLIEIS